MYYLCVVRWNVLKVQMFIHLLVGLLCTQRCCTESNYHRPRLCGNKVSSCIVYLVICQSSPSHPEPETSSKRPDIWGHSRSQLTRGFLEIRPHVNLFRTPSTLTHWRSPFTRKAATVYITRQTLTNRFFGPGFWIP